MITRTTSLSRPYIISKIFNNFPNTASTNSTGSLEFFNIGFPGTTPISPVGTILIILNSSFLSNNTKSFIWGCVGDNGGIKNGFNPYISKEHYKEVRLNYKQMLKIQDIIKNLPPIEQDKVLNNKVSEIFIENARQILPPIVINSISQNGVESSRKIEFCLKGDINIENKDIYKVIIPNTYKKLLHRKKAFFSKEKIQYYNPKNHPLLEI